MKFILTFLTLISFQLSLFAHEGGHGNSKTWIVNNKPIQDKFLKYEDGKVFFLDENHGLLSFELDALSPKHQEIILDKSATISSINQSQMKTNNKTNSVFIGLGILLLLLSFIFFLKHRKKYHLAYGFIGVLLLLFSACNKNDNSDLVNDNSDIDEEPLPILPANDISFMQSIFGSFSEVKTSSDNTYFYVSSNGIPSHNMMIGITNWQQQIPIDQDYSATNSWAIPIRPVLAENPLSTETNLLKGAIAIAANGIPIFNPLNNRSEDANTIGELDQWGGHCGRADDYHYHLPPIHLQATIGAGKPVAYAVDGFPVYGETTEELDEYLGRFNDDGSYQYHTITQFPYFIAGMRGEVTLDPTTSAPENQVIPQAMTKGVRPALKPLNGAAITNFQAIGTNSYSLTYSLNSENYRINYGWDNNGLYTYEFINPNGNSITETYQR
jgi:LPXTG-motif cell wall-anchored protein